MDMMMREGVFGSEDRAEAELQRQYELELAKIKQQSIIAEQNRIENKRKYELEASNRRKEENRQIETSALVNKRKNPSDIITSFPKAWDQGTGISDKKHLAVAFISTNPFNQVYINMPQDTCQSRSEKGQSISPIFLNQVRNIMFRSWVEIYLCRNK